MANHLEKIAPRFSSGAKKLGGEYALFSVLDIAVNLESSCLDAFPKLKAFYDEINAQDAVKKVSSGLGMYFSTA